MMTWLWMMRAFFLFGTRGCARCGAARQAGATRSRLGSPLRDIVHLDLPACDEDRSDRRFDADGCALPFEEAPCGSFFFRAPTFGPEELPRDVLFRPAVAPTAIALFLRASVTICSSGKKTLLQLTLGQLIVKYLRGLSTSPRAGVREVCPTHA